MTANDDIESSYFQLQEDNMIIKTRGDVADTEVKDDELDHTSRLTN